MDFAKRAPELHVSAAIPRNFRQGRAIFNDSKCFVIAGDEYDAASFRQNVTVHIHISRTSGRNNVDFDHATSFTT